MKALKRPATKSEMIKKHPLEELVNGWFFKCTEVKNSHYVAEGCDIYGHIVSAEGSDYDKVLEKAIKYADEIKSHE